jgi:type VI secretion system secreted protein Hcp
MAQVDYFLKIDGIDGESTDDRHKGEIEIESFSWGESNFGSAASGGGGAGAGKVSMNDFHFVMRLSKASPKLFLACASGEHLTEAQLTVGRAGGDQIDYLYWKLSDCLVTSYQTGASSAGADTVPTDSFSLNFSKIEISYKEQKADGSLGTEHRAGWDLSKNTKI